MKKAHYIFNKHNKLINFGLCLRLAWAEINHKNLQTCQNPTSLINAKKNLVETIQDITAIIETKIIMLKEEL